MAVKDMAVAVAIAALLVAASAVGVALARARRGVALRPALVAAGIDAALVLALITVGVLTLWPAADDPTDRARLILVPFRSSPGNLVGNVLLFLPVGAFAALRLPVFDSARRTGLAAAALSLSVEAVQYLFVPGRHADITDVIGNTAGALLGYLAVTRALATSAFVRGLRRPPRNG